MIFVFHLALGQSENIVIESVKVSENYVDFYLSDQTNSYTTLLSNDKTSIKINLAIEDKEKFIPEKRNIVKEIVFNNGEDKGITINTLQRTGYTTYLLPYSNILRIYLFDWDNLTVAEDKFHTALLGIEAGIETNIREELKKSSELKNPDATALLGLYMLQDSAIEKSQKVLNLSEKLNSDIFDIYAALYHIATIKNNTVKQSEYLSKYKKLSSRDELNLLEIKNNASLYEGDSLFLSIIDSLSATIKDKDTTNKEIETKFSNIFKDTTDTNSTIVNSSGTEQPYWVEFGIYGLLALVLLTAYFYMRWRNQQLKKNTTKKARRIRNEAKEQRFEEKLKAEQKKTQVANKKVIEKYQPDRKVDTTPKTKEKPNKGKQSLADLIKSGDSDKISDVLKSKSAEKEKESKLSAKLQLAMQLANEQKEIKKKNINSLGTEKLPTDPEQLRNVAKKLGIERGSLETKNALEKLQQDKESISKLQSKMKKK